MPGQQPADAAAVAAIGVAYQRHVQAQRTSLAAFLTRLWWSMADYRRAAPFVTQAVPAVAGAQQNVAALTAAYLARHRQLHLGGSGRPVAVGARKVTGSVARAGTTPAEVYERPFHLVWRQLADGTSPPNAIQAGLDRTVQSALTDLQLTKTRTAKQILDRDPRVTGYRRVLEGTHSCALCIVAATQRYHRAELLPVHPACDCSVEPLYTPDEQVTDEALLAAAHAAVRKATGKTASDARAIDYRDFLVVHHHGELGPVLARKGATFLGPNDL